MTERVSILKKYDNEIVLAGFVLLVGALLFYLTVKVGGCGSGASLRVHADFDAASGLVEGNAVTIAGVKVGTVAKIDLDYAGTTVRARIELDLYPKAQIRRDVRASIRSRSLLGEKYVALLPRSRSAPLLRTGDAITDTYTPLEIDQLLEKLSPIGDTIARLGAAAEPLVGEITKTVATLNRGLDAHGDETFGEVLGLLRDARSTVAEARALVASARPRIARIVRNADRLLASGDLDAMSKDARDVVASLRRDLPAMIARADRTLAALEKLTGAFPPDTGLEIARTIAHVSHATAQLDAMVSGTGLHRMTRDLARVLARLAAVDEALVREFLQVEGVTFHLFTGNAEARVKKLRASDSGR